MTPGPGNRPNDVERDQRERLYAGLVAATAERGYAATRVADVIERAGISRSTFYRHFGSLYDCLLQTLDTIVASAEAEMAVELESAGPWNERLRGCFDALMPRRRSPRSRMSDALARLDESMAGFQALLAEGLRRRSQPSGVAVEAIGASILALGYEDLTRRGAGTLYELVPPAAFVALAPAIGTIEACTIVNSG